MKLKNEHIHPMFLLAAAAIALTIANVHAGPILAGPLAANDSRLVLANGASIVSGGVEVDTTAAEGEYHEYLCSLPDKIKLESGKTYRLSYDYTVNKVGGDNTEFYHIFRTGVNYDLDKNEFWSAAVGSKGHKEFTVKLDGADYKFILGVRFKGAIRIENLRLEEVAASALTPGIPFSLPSVKDARFVLQEGATLVSGGIEVDTTASDNEWHEYFLTVPAFVPFVSGKTYTVSYDYTVKKVGGDDTEFYHIFRSGKNIELDRNEFWSAAAGSKGHKEFTAKLEDAPDWKLILGVHFKGAIRIENLKLEEQHEGVH